MTISLYCTSLEVDFQTDSQGIAPQYNKKKMKIEFIDILRWFQVMYTIDFDRTVCHFIYRAFETQKSEGEVQKSIDISLHQRVFTVSNGMNIWICPA